MLLSSNTNNLYVHLCLFRETFKTKEEKKGKRDVDVDKASYSKINCNILTQNKYKMVLNFIRACSLDD
jgi:hypothetical protein